MKKRGIFIILISLVLAFFILQIFFIRADSFGIGWGSSEGGVRVGGSSTTILPIGPIPPSPPNPPPGTTPPPTGGPGGGITIGTPDFSLDNLFIPVQIKRGLPRLEIITITNNKNTDLQVNISQDNLTNFAFTPESSIILKPNEKREIDINLYVPESEKRDFVSGNINFQSAGLKKSVIIILDIREKTALFDIKTTLFQKILIPGQRAIANIKILNFGDLRNFDVQLQSSIIDPQNNTYDSKKEMFAINDSSTKSVSLNLPRNIPLGKYFFSSTVSYQNVSANSYDSFEVIKSIISTGLFTFYIILVIIVTLIIHISSRLVNRVKMSKEQQLSAY
jgi:hypothetical protein